MRKRLGVTVAEVLVATLLLAVCLLFVITAMLGVFRSATKGEDQAIALEIADKLLTELADADSAFWSQIAQQTSQLYTHDPQSQTEFTSELQWVRTEQQVMGSLCALTVTVSWWPDASGASSSRREYGRQSVQLTRTVYEAKSP